MTNSEEEYIVEITGGPMKYHRKKLRRNPNFRPAIPITEPRPEWLIAIGKELQQARLANRLTQKVVAKSLRSYQPVISSIENGRANPTIKFLERYCQAIGKKMSITIS